MRLREEYYGKVVAVVLNGKGYQIDKDFLGKYKNSKQLILDNPKIMSKYFEGVQVQIEVEVEPKKIDAPKPAPIRKNKKRAAK